MFLHEWKGHFLVKESTGAHNLCTFKSIFLLIVKNLKTTASLHACILAVSADSRKVTYLVSIMSLGKLFNIISELKTQLPNQSCPIAFCSS